MCKCIKSNNKIIFNGPNKNASVEHIIPNAIGGKLKSSKLLCKKCNSDYGKECDSVLCKQLEFITVMLNPSRDRQTNLTFKTSSNEKYDISLNGKPVLKKPQIKQEKNGDHIHYKIISRSRAEANQILKNIKKKYPNLDIESVKNNIISSKEYINEGINIDIKLGGELFLKAIYKIILEYYIENGGNPKNTELYDKNIHIFALSQFIFDKYTKDTINHGIFIKGDPKEKYLIGYVELYKAYRYIVLLDDNYNGDYIESYYCYDLFNNKQLDNIFIEPNINLKTLYEKNLKNLNNNITNSIKDNLNTLLFLLLKRQHEMVLNDIIDASIKKYTDNPSEDFTKILMSNLTPYIISLIKNVE